MIHVVIGTKAQLIKMAPIMKLLQDENTGYNYISTGQHRETMDDIHRNFGLKSPDYRLYQGKDITSVTRMAAWGTSNILRTVQHKREIFKNDTNGIVLVHGDTFSTLLGAVMGKVAGLKVAHIESGLRSFRLLHPFPEEITRILTFRLADYMFCPGEWAINNLEKYSDKTINTGLNTLYDSLRHALPAIEAITDVEIPDHAYGIITLHRFENIYKKQAVDRILSIIERISRKKQLLFIMHKPTRMQIEKYGYLQRLERNPNIHLRPRYDYYRFIRLVMDAEFLISDGGSNQEECYYLGKPVLLLRKATERTEGLGRNCVLSEYKDALIDEFIDNVHKYRFDFLDSEQSPSRVIIEHCRQFI
jgi:UDP-N-acetylglucosamine 2-epimerase (non-hydrolysing)